MSDQINDESNDESNDNGNDTIDLILFDLGGVLVDTSGDPLPSHWFPPGRTSGLAQWFAAPAARAFELGEISSADFTRALKDDLGIDASEEAILDRFTHWPRGLFPGAARLLERLRRTHTLAVLSNTNAAHWPRLIDDFGLADYCDHLFASHLIGKAKPDPEAFRHVLEALGTEPGRILFFDDKAENVTTAVGMGFQGVQVAGIEAVSAALASRGL